MKGQAFALSEGRHLWRDHSVDHLGHLSPVNLRLSKNV